MANQELKEALEATLNVFKEQCKDDYLGEENVKIKLVLPILEKLRWDIINDADFEYSAKGRRVDCCLSKNKKPTLLIEVKAFNENRDQTKDEDQIKDYCIKTGVPYCVLTDGIDWKLYVKRFKKVEPWFFPKRMVDIDCCSREKDNDVVINNVFNEFWCIEKVNYTLNNDMCELDEIWNDSFVELVKSLDTDSRIDVLVNRLKYEMMSKSVEPNIDEKIFREYVKRKIKIRNSLKKIVKEKRCIDIYREIFSKEFDSKSLGIIKEHVTSFVQKLGWQIEIKEGNLVVLKFENIPVSLIWMKVFGRRTSGVKADDMNFLMGHCKDLGVRYGVVTNGIRWEFYEFERILIKDDSCCLFNEVKLEKDKIEQVADFLSMFSENIIANLPDMVTSSRFFDCVLAEERNQELKEEVLKAKENNEKMEELAKKLCDKVQEMKPDIAEDFIVDYLKSYIRWYGTENTAPRESKKQKKGKLSVKFPGGMVNNELPDVDVFCETLKRIGLDKIVRSGVINCKVPVVSMTDYPAYIYITYPNSKIRNIDGYYILAHGSTNVLANLIRKIKSKLSELYPNDIEFLNQIEVEPK